VSFPKPVAAGSLYASQTIRARAIPRQQEEKVEPSDRLKAPRRLQEVVTVTYFN
jgi:hypothetical protein